jgi:hypothetical protein
VVSPSPSDYSLSQVLLYYPLVAFYAIDGRKREVLFFYFVPDTTRDYSKYKKSQTSHEMAAYSSQT